MLSGVQPNDANMDPDPTGSKHALLGGRRHMFRDKMAHVWDKIKKGFWEHRGAIAHAGAAAIGLPFFAVKYKVMDDPL